MTTARVFEHVSIGTACGPAPATMQEIAAEHDAIAAPTETTLIVREAFQKHGAVSIQSKYRSALPPRSLLEHYDRLLGMHRWRRLQLRDVTEWGKETGGWAADYCKGRRKASLQYAGRAHADWTYAFSVSASTADPTCREPGFGD